MITEKTCERFFFLDKRFSTSPVVCFTEKHLVPGNGLDEISYCLPNRSILRSDSQDKYQSALLLFDDNIFECVDSLCYSGALYAFLVSKSKNQVFNILVYHKNNLPAQRFLEGVRYMVLSKKKSV